MCMRPASTRDSAVSHSRHVLLVIFVLFNKKTIKSRHIPNVYNMYIQVHADAVAGRRVETFGIFFFFFLIRRGVLGKTIVLYIIIITIIFITVNNTHYILVLNAHICVRPRYNIISRGQRHTYREHQTAKWKNTK